MCEKERPGLSPMDLPKCGAIDIEKLAYAALGLFNLAVYPVGG